MIDELTRARKRIADLESELRGAYSVLLCHGSFQHSYLSVPQQGNHILAGLMEMGIPLIHEQPI
jgi:hypothetical protein